MLSKSEILITKRFLFSKKSEGYVSIFSWFSIIGIALGVAAIIENHENIDTLYDDRNCSIGKKLSDNDLIGTPIQIIIGKRDLAEGLIEVKDRILDKTEKIQIDEVKKVALEKLKS